MSHVGVTGTTLSSVSADPALELYAASRRYALGVPRQVQVADDASLALFLRTSTGTGPRASLWQLPLRGDSAGTAVQAAAPEALVDEPDDLSDEESARQRRNRSALGGITSFAGTPSLSVVTLTLAGQCFVLRPRDGVGPQRLPVPGPVFDPRPSPDGTRVAYVRDGLLQVSDLDGNERQLTKAEGEHVSWGLAEFIAAEEMGRSVGFWWAPNSEWLLVTRVDTSSVTKWRLFDPAEPASVPREIPFPAAGTANAEVSLWLIHVDGGQIRVLWDDRRFPYLVTVKQLGDQPTIVVQSRDQRTIQVLSLDSSSGETAVRHEDHAGHWLRITPGVPDQLTDGRLVWVTEADDTRRLLIGTEIVTPPELQLRHVLGVVDDEVLFVASTDPRETQLWRFRDGRIEQLTEEPGVHTGTLSAGGLVIVSETLARSTTRIQPRTATGAGNVEPSLEVPAVAAEPPSPPEPSFRLVGERQLQTALLVPRSISKRSAPDARLPVVLAPYGGPGAQRVVASRKQFAAQQWLADQGFAVVVIDGRGTPGRGLEWEHAVDGDLATAALEDQIDGLLALADQEPRLDLARVGILGWSFGGYLALTAAMRRPDIIKAAVAGAPVTDWHLYDTHYTERFLGIPHDHWDGYQRSNLPDQIPEPPPALLLIHGLLDDNVFPAHSLSASDRLLRAGWQHETMYLPGTAHGITDPQIIKAVMTKEAEFLRTALA